MELPERVRYPLSRENRLRQVRDLLESLRALTEDDESLRFLERVIRSTPKDDEAWNKYAIALKRTGAKTLPPDLVRLYLDTWFGMPAHEVANLANWPMTTEPNPTYTGS